MVTVLQVDQLKYKVNQRDHAPPHVHVEGPGASIRINLLTFAVMDKKTEFSEAMIRRIQRFVKENANIFLEIWEEFHGEN